MASQVMFVHKVITAHKDQSTRKTAQQALTTLQQWRVYQQIAYHAHLVNIVLVALQPTLMVLQEIALQGTIAQEALKYQHKMQHNQDNIL
jgi:hypothetical protein